MKAITDKASISVDFPDKAYMGSFGRESGFEVRADADEVLLKLVRGGNERREVAVHLHYYLLADILGDMATALADAEPLDEAHRAPMREAAQALTKALNKRRRKG